MAIHQSAPPKVDDPRFWQWLYVFWERTSELMAASGSNTGDVTVTDSASVNLTVTGQDVTAVVIPGGVDHSAMANLNTTSHTHLTSSQAAVAVAQYQAGESLSGHRAVVLNTSGQAIYASNDTLSHAKFVLGITTGASAALDTATIQTGGEMTEPTWSWTLGQPIYLGANGALTQTVPEAPTAAFLLVVGFPITATKIFINIMEPLALI